MKLLIRFLGLITAVVTMVNCSTIQFQNVDTSSGELLIWSADHKLTEADFLAPIPEKTTDRSGNVYFSLPMQFQKMHILLPTNIQVNACMNKKVSWYNRKIAVPGTLDYFQLMFDSYEVHARLLKKKISEADINPVNPTETFSKLANEVQSAASTSLAQIETETDHGTNKAEVIRWRAQIDQRLLELDAFK